MKRGPAQVLALPQPGPGFIAEGHTAIHVIDAREFAHNDPFIVLADDRIDLPPGRRAGGAHPHAGFEIIKAGSGGFNHAAIDRPHLRQSAVRYAADVDNADGGSGFAMRVLVREDPSGETIVAYHPAASMTDLVVLTDAQLAGFSRARE